MGSAGVVKRYVAVCLLFHVFSCVHLALVFPGIRQRLQGVRHRPPWSDTLAGARSLSLGKVFCTIGRGRLCIWICPPLRDPRLSELRMDVRSSRSALAPQIPRTPDPDPDPDPTYNQARGICTSNECASLSLGHEVQFHSSNISFPIYPTPSTVLPIKWAIKTTPSSFLFRLQITAPLPQAGSQRNNLNLHLQLSAENDLES